MKLTDNLTGTDKSLLNTYKAELFLLIVTFSWGLSFPLIKLSLGSVSPVLFNFLRFTFTLILFYLVFKKKLKNISSTEIKYGLILGFFLFLGFVFQTIGLKYTTATKSAFITGTNLIFIPFIQYFILKSSPKIYNLIGALIVVTGLFILSESYELIPNTGDILTIFCALFFAVHIVLLNKYSVKADLNILIFGQFLASAVLGLLFTFFYEFLILDEVKFIPDTILFITILYTVIFTTLISIVLMTKYQHLTTPLRAGIIYNMESVFALFFAYIILNEIMNYNQVIGIIIMISGLLISEFTGLFTLNKRIGKKN